MIKFIFIGFSIFSSPAPQDSLGVETINGKVFVVHKVDEKETLYSISRRYGATVDEIKQFNTNASTGLEIGQILKVPYTRKQIKTVTNAGTGTIHKVAQKETLYSIARTYGVSMDDIKTWNNLTDNSLTIGQELVIKKKAAAATVTQTQQQNTVSAKGTTHIVGEKETMYGIARQHGITVDQLRQWNNLQGVELKIGQVLKIAPEGQPVKNEVTEVKANTNVSTTTTSNNTVANTTKSNEQSTTTQEKKEPVPVKTETPVIQEPIKISESVKNSDEIIEAGVAELIEGTEGNRKYLALHRTAPVGTILKVRNEMNNREVFVRVMGKLPDTALTDKLIIKISKSAYDRLGAIDPKFRVQVTYYK
jgi:LysM repeat protein